ncbi:hypothetical protein EVAR_96623_1 [Eumeta japonica]|uniref:Nucleic-acid-binding protein from transposon X-element n=1 Tax=Eumeta variegata TaxID=151549 RepID=A0A4C1WV07_EUMVA|nr:hypothetical protein EVAR_96623_1 [Eumeta japonica]
MPGQCHRCQLYGHAAANHAQPGCVKCLVPHWNKHCERKKEAGGKPSCCNCGQEHTANYKGCPVAPKPKPVNKINSKSSSACGKDYRPAPFPVSNSWNKPLPWVKPQTINETCSKKSRHQIFGHSGTVTTTLRADISTIISILQVVKSAEVADLAAKFRNVRHGVDRLRIILENP